MVGVAVAAPGGASNDDPTITVIARPRVIEKGKAIRRRRTMRPHCVSRLRQEPNPGQRRSTFDSGSCFGGWARSRRIASACRLTSQGELREIVPVYADHTYQSTFGIVY